ncbi:MAG TPA: DUF4386 domain-containing protein [Gemmatimonadales bacterium]|nr:DUF4386 domain-containing protein [Gemmatimonadales bacterium]
MGTMRFRAIITGLLFIIASTTAVIGYMLYGPIIDGPDYLVNGAARGNLVVLGALNEFILACAAIGTGLMLYPHLRRHDESLALGYVCFRFFEAVVITVGLVGVLALLSVSRDFAGSSAPDAEAFRATGTALLAVREWAFILGPGVLLGLNTSMYSYVLFRTRLVPRPIAAMGMTGAALVLIAGLLMLLDVLQPMSPGAGLLSATVAVYEMVLAAWLIAKGFNAEAVAPAPTTVAMGTFQVAAAAGRG